MKKLRNIFIALLIISIFVIPACAMEVDSASNKFIFDRTVFFQDNIQGDLVSFGNDVSIKGSALGDVIAAGRTVFIQIADTTSNIYAAGSTVAISPNKAKNIYAVGGYVKIDKTANVNGAYIAGNDLFFSGTTKELYAAGENVNIDGNVSGKLVIHSSNISISNAAKIDGTVEIYGSKEPILPATINKANVKFTKIMPKDNEQRRNQMGMGMVIFKLLGILTAVLIAIILTALNSRYIKEKADEFKSGLGRFILRGLIAFIVIPIASVIAMFLIITIPISIIVLMLYGITLFIAPVYTGAVLGRFFLKNVNRYLSAMAGAAVVGIVLLIPFVGALAFLFCAFYTLGSILNNVKLGKKEEVPQKKVVEETKVETKIEEITSNEQINETDQQDK